MKKALKFTLVVVWIVLTRAYDAYSTFVFTPDLSREANPLVSVLGMDWTPLLIVIGVLTTYAIYAFYIRTFRQFKLLPDEPGYSISDFITHIYLGRKDHWTAMLYKLPDSWQRFHHYMGAYLTRCLVFAGIVSTVMWLSINYIPAYADYHSARLIYYIIVIGCLGIGIAWYRHLFQQYRTALL